MRQRIEDLGRLAAMLTHITNDLEDTHIGDLDDFMETYAPKELDILYTEKLEELYNRLSYMKDRIYDCVDIAYGDDFRNRDDENSFCGNR